MLRSFVYLDELTLHDYVSMLEGGLRERRTDETTAAREREGHANIKVAGGSAGSSATSSQSVESSDTVASRFDRLLELAEDSPERSGWVDVVTLDDLATAGVGAFVDFECDLDIPDIVRVTSAPEMSAMLDLMESLPSMAGLLGEDMEGMPTTGEVSGIRAMTSIFQSTDLIVVGEDDESEVKIAGSLKRSHLRTSLDDLSGSVRITAKVGKRIKQGEFKPLLGLPGMSILPREARLEMERKRPSDDEADNYLAGPARLLNILAIYT